MAFKFNNTHLELCSVLKSAMLYSIISPGNILTVLTILFRQNSHWNKLCYSKVNYYKLRIRQIIISACLCVCACRHTYTCMAYLKNIYWISEQRKEKLSDQFSPIRDNLFTRHMQIYMENQWLYCLPYLPSLPLISWSCPVLW